MAESESDWIPELILGIVAAGATAWLTYWSLVLATAVVKEIRRGSTELELKGFPPRFEPVKKEVRTQVPVEFPFIEA